MKHLEIYFNGTSSWSEQNSAGPSGFLLRFESQRKKTQLSALKLSDW